ncbi:heterokaryon incompatibility protein-domain-containing protein [Lasiosphaeria ovina]|uniref:Heterokaryon incompatibility protein-domain-containing protein n=1 Tax=Lasiosphaeria ovina TaxID=92902 RepID=A0AAE0K3K8_9PEZI|nr:heterokaryon incompatibility protein-domain-containing protein [Lasiosphaeria ovina]
MSSEPSAIDSDSWSDSELDAEKALGLAVPAPLNLTGKLVTATSTWTLVLLADGLFAIFGDPDLYPSVLLGLAGVGTHFVDRPWRVLATSVPFVVAAGRRLTRVGAFNWAMAIWIAASSTVPTLLAMIPRARLPTAAAAAAAAAAILIPGPESNEDTFWLERTDRVVLTAYQLACVYTAPRVVRIFPRVFSDWDRVAWVVGSVAVAQFCAAAATSGFAMLGQVYPGILAGSWRIMFGRPLAFVSRLSEQAERRAHRLVLWASYPSVKEFGYQRLDKKKFEVRLLMLLPGSFLAPVQATLVVCQIGRVPRFEAVSYRWDPNSPPQPILLDGQRFMVSGSLYTMLAYLRHEDSPRLLWVDALCINQADNDEKSWQVTGMGRIYRAAGAVLGWLGPSTKGFNPLATISLSGALRQLRKSLLGLFRGRRNQWLDVILLLSNEWFSRVWIVQEAAFAKVLTLRLGAAEISWEAFEEVVSVFNERGAVFEALINGPGSSERVATAARAALRNVVSLNAIRVWVRENRDTLVSSSRSPHVRGLLFYEVVRRCGTFTSTDPRDRVYGLLGLSTRLARRTVSIDYTKAAATVLADAARFTLLHEGFKETLDLAGMGHYRHQPSPFLKADSQLPSWAPDWTKSNFPLGHFSTANLTVPAGRYSCATDDISVARQLIQTVPGYPELLFFGSVGLIDTIHAVSPVWEPPAATADRASQAEAMASFLSGIDVGLDMAKRASCSRYPNDSGGGENLLWRTVLLKEQPGDDGTVQLEVDPKVIRDDISSLRDIMCGDRLRFQVHWMTFSTYRIRILTALRWAIGKRFCVTEGGYFGLVPAFTEPGDRLAVVAGAENPFVLRQTLETLMGTSTLDILLKGKQSVYRLVGACHIEGIMFGELADGNIPFEPGEQMPWMRRRRWSPLADHTQAPLHLTCRLGPADFVRVRRELQPNRSREGLPFIEWVRPRWTHVDRSRRLLATGRCADEVKEPLGRSAASGEGRGDESPQQKKTRTNSLTADSEGGKCTGQGSASIETNA